MFYSWLPHNIIFTEGVIKACTTYQCMGWGNPVCCKHTSGVKGCDFSSIWQEAHPVNGERDWTGDTPGWALIWLPIERFEKVSCDVPSFAGEVWVSYIGTTTIRLLMISEWSVNSTYIMTKEDVVAIGFLCKASGVQHLIYMQFPWPS